MGRILLLKRESHLQKKTLAAPLENAEASSFDASTAATATAPAGDATTAVATSDAVKHACGDATNVTLMQR